MADLVTPTLGLPYANPDDPLGGAAASMGALALALDAGVQVRVGTAAVTTDSAAWGATEVNVLSVTGVPVIAGRIYRVRLHCDLLGSVAGDNHLIRIREDSLTGTVLDFRRYRVNAVTNFPYTTEVEYTAAVDDAAKTFVVGGVRDAGATGLCTRKGSSTAPAYLYVDLIR